MNESWEQSSPGVGSFGEIRWFSQIDSTNRYLLDQAREGVPHGLVAVADEQTAGRGRRGRTWIAPPGTSLMFSVLLRPSEIDYSGAPFAFGAAMALAARNAIDASVDIKYPNDLLIGEKKLSGILVETHFQGDVLQAVVVGMGTNVSWPHDLPDEIARTATALNLEGVDIDRQALLLSLLKNFDSRLTNLNSAIDELSSACVTLGKTVKVSRDSGELVGVAESIASDGGLIVRDDSGEHRIDVADVVHVR